MLYLSFDIINRYYDYIVDKETYDIKDFYRDFVLHLDKKGMNDIRFDGEDFSYTFELTIVNKDIHIKIIKMKGIKMKEIILELDKLISKTSIKRVILYESNISLFRLKN